MKKKIAFIFFITVVCLSAQVISESILNNITLLAINNFANTQNIQNGFIKQGEGETIDYHSALPGVKEALLTRALDGKMKISWLAQSPENSDEVTYFWLAGIGANLGIAHFDIFLNDKKITTITAKDQNFELTEKSGVKLDYSTTYVDGSRDYFGLMSITFPKNYLEKGQPMEFSVIGHNENLHTWYMTFMAENISDKLLYTAKNGKWYRIVNYDNNYSISLPLSYANKDIKVNGKSVTLKASEDFLIGKIETINYPLTIEVGGKVMDKIQSVEDNTMEIFTDGKIKTRSINKKLIEYSESYFSDLAANIAKLQKSSFKDANIHLISSSHQDIAWMDDPKSCEIQRDKQIISPAFKLLAENPNYKYSAEQALMLYEYLDRHPDSIDEIRKFTQQNRLEWGASYNQPYEGFWRGESLIRQFYFGRKWLKKQLPGIDPKVYFNVDVPGRTIQMPQIATKCGVDYMVISRHEKSFFWWKSPDGSKMGVHSPGHYHAASEFLRSPASVIISQAPKEILSNEKIFADAKLPKEVPILFSSDMLVPKDFDNFFKSWDNLSVDGKRSSLPKWQYNTFQPVMKKIFSEGKNIPELMGERPNVWLYIHGPSHYRLATASRESGRLLPVAESFSTINSLLEKDFSSYPQNELNDAWLNHIYPDHGFGGQDGYITDQLFKTKSELALATAEEIINEKLNDIASKIEIKNDNSIVLFNNLTQEKEDVARAKLKFSKGEMTWPILLDSKNDEVFSNCSVLANHDDGSIAAVEVSFNAIVPSLGYSTYHVKDGRKIEQTNKNTDTSFENDFYKIEFVNGGIKSIFDNELGEELLETDKFLGFEVIGLASVGNGAGEFDQVQQSTTDFFERSSKYKSIWVKKDDNSVFSEYTLKTRLENCVLEQSVVIFHNIKKIDFAVDVLNWDNTVYREYRLAFPIKNQDSKVTYEVPFGIVTVGEDEIPGAAGERYQQPANDLHPREVLDWISANNKDFGVTFSSCVSVWDYEDITGLDNNSCLLQPILLASRKSCHHNGNWYLQPGDHHFKFSMTSHEKGWKNGFTKAKSFNNPFNFTFKGKSQKGSLPEQYSFMSLTEEKVLLSTLKKAEDCDDIIVRLYNMDDKNHATELNFFNDIKSISTVNGIEEDATNISMKKLKIGHHSIETFKLK